MPTKPNTKALKALIVRLGQEPDLLEAYTNAPKEVMLGAGVPAKQINVVLTGRQKEIEALLGSGHMAVMIIVTPK